MASVKQIIGILIISAVLVIGLTLFVNQKNDSLSAELLYNEDGQVEELGGPLTLEEREITQIESINSMNPTAVFTTNKGVITLELFADLMPITVGNFVKLANEGYYNNTKFHRVIDNFMIQGGDPNSKGSDASIYGTGGPGYTIQDEFVAGELLTNLRGTIAMANTGQPNSGGSQFFINTVNNTGLDFDKEPLASKHPVFGRVIEGLDVVDSIATVETGPRDLPVEPVVIESVTIVPGTE